VELWLDCDPELPTLRLTDPTRLRQILINLVGNAVKFTDKGEVCLSAGPGTAGDGQDGVLFCVADTGIGIPADKQTLLFQPFTQVDDSNLRRHGGTGLGLSISRSLAEMMGGTLICKSEPGVGSEFAFTLPMPIAPTAVRQQPESHKRIWCLCASEGSARSVSSLMAVLGHQFRLDRLDTGSGPDAWRVDQPQDLILFDSDPTITRNLESTLKSIRSQDRTRGLPVIVLTRDVAPSCTSPRVDFVRKPIRLHLLRERIDSCHTIPVEKAVDAPLIEPARNSLAEWKLDIPDQPLLLVEDNPVNQKVASLLLKRLGFRVVLAQERSRGNRKIRSQTFSLVVMDIQMPRMDGIEATQWIRNNLPIDQQPAIIAMTAGVTQLDRKVCFDAGMDGFVEKPVRIDALMDEMSRVIATTSGKSAP
jgi:CheY-like chemotaxis protein